MTIPWRLYNKLIQAPFKPEKPLPCHFTVNLTCGHHSVGYDRHEVLPLRNQNVTPSDSL